MLLEARNLSVRYDTAMIINNLSFSVDSGELVVLVGPNGAGKTTLLRAVTGLILWEKEVYKGTSAGGIRLEGEVYFRGERIDRKLPHEIAGMGLIHCPERRRPFPEMTVSDNLKAGAYLNRNNKVTSDNLEKVYSLFPVLKRRGIQLAGTLSGGEQQMLAIGRALMVDPVLLCIDEPSTGLAPVIKQNLFEKINEIKGMGTTILLVEQDVRLSISLSTRAYVLSHGRVAVEGKGKELLEDETVRNSYLGL